MALEQGRSPSRSSSLFMTLALWVGLVFNAITIMLPKLVEQRVTHRHSAHARSGVLATAVFLCGGMAQFTMGRAGRARRAASSSCRSSPASRCSVCSRALYTSGWWLLPSLALAVAAIYGQVTVNDHRAGALHAGRRGAGASTRSASSSSSRWRGRRHGASAGSTTTAVSMSCSAVGAIIAVLGALEHVRDQRARHRRGEQARGGEPARAGGGAAGGVTHRRIACVRARGPIPIQVRNRMGDNMRLVLLCSVFAFLLATAPADAQRPAASAKPPAAAKKTNTVRKPAPPPPDTRPILRRDETAAAIPIPAQPTAKPKKRTARKPADAARGAAAAPQTARAGAKDVSECGQVREPDRVIAGCTLVIGDSRQKPKARAAAYYNRGNAHSCQGRACRRDRRLR